MGLGKGEGRVIDPLACIGRPPEHRDYRESHGLFEPAIDESARIEAFCTVDAGRFRPTWIGARAWLMKGCHVGHDSIIGEDCELSPHVALGGHVTVGDRVRIGLGAVVRPRVTIGDGAQIGMGAVVVKDIPAGETWVGNPARPIRERSTEDYVLTAYEHWYDSWHV